MMNRKGGLIIWGFMLIVIVLLLLILFVVSGVCDINGCVQGITELIN